MSKIPKDKQIIITTVTGNYVAVWSDADKQFVYASPRIDMYQGEWNMHYFENEYIDEKDILGWREL